MPCQANNCYSDLCSTTWWESSFQSITEEQDSPFTSEWKEESWQVKNITIIQSFWSHSGDYGSGHLLSTINNKPVLIFQSGIGFLCLPQNKNMVLGRMSETVPHSLALDSMLSPVSVKFYKLISFHKQTAYCSWRKECLIQAKKSNLSLSCDFQLLGCCSYLLFPPLEPESLFVATGKAQGEKNAITIHRWSVRQPLRKNTADKINSLWCP